MNEIPAIEYCSIGGGLRIRGSDAVFEDWNNLDLGFEELLYRFEDEAWKAGWFSL